MFLLWCTDWVGSHYANQILCMSVLRVASGPRVKFASYKSALTPFAPSPPPTSGGLLYWRSKAVVSVLVLLFVAFLVYSTRRFVLCLTLCDFVLVFFSPFSIAITSLGEERANLSAFRTFIRFALVWFVCFLFLLVSWKGFGLWLWHSLDFFLPFFDREQMST